MPRSLSTASGLLAMGVLLAGCGAGQDVWLIEVDTTKGDGYSCASGYETNFNGTLRGGSVPSTGPVTERYESTGSKSVFYAKVVDLANGQRSLNTGSLLLPGKDLGKGKWSFQWTEAASDRHVVEHEAGYALEEIFRSTGTTTIELTFEGRTATGSMTVESGESTEQRESDEWSEEAAAYMGITGELAWYSTNGVTSNSFDSAECKGNPCTSITTSVCGATAPATAVRTDLSKGEDFGSLVSLEQYGSFKVTSSSSWSGGWDSGF